jgi:hypothetical protein
MYFWKIHALVEDLKHDRVSQTQFKNYYLVFGVSCSLLLFPMENIGDRSPGLILLDIAITLFITFIGIQFTFKANGGEQGSAFIARSLALSLPIAVRSLTVSLFLLFATFLGFELMGYGDISESPWVLMLFGWTLQVLIFERLYMYLSQIRASEISARPYRYA